MPSSAAALRSRPRARALSCRVNTTNKDPDEALARLSQEATNQSTPDQSIAGAKERRALKRKVALNRTKAPRN